MKCKIKSFFPAVENKEVRCHVVGTVTNPMLEFIPVKIWKWIESYEGIAISFNGEDSFKISAWGTALCSDEDEFNLKKGKNLAESRAKAKVYRFVRTYSDKMSTYLGSLAEKFDDELAHYLVRVEQEKDHICDLVNED